MGTIVNGNTYYTGKGVKPYDPNDVDLLLFGGLKTPGGEESIKANQMKLAGYNVIYDDYVPPQQNKGFLNDFVNNPLGTVSNTVSNFVENPAKTLNDYWNSGGRDAAILAALTAAAVASGGTSLAVEGAGAGALAAQTAAEASSAAAAGGGAAAAGSAGAGALAAQIAAEGSSAAAGTNALAAGSAGAGALAAQTAAEASSAAPLAGAGAAAGTGALAAQTAAEGSSAIPLAGAGAALPAAAAAGTASWMTPAAIVGSSLIGANAAQKAAQTQADAAAQANQLLAQMYATQRADLAPFTAAGVGAQNQLLTYLGLPGGTQGADYGKYAKDFGLTDFTTDPGYGFRLSEGQKALERSAAARGGLLSGGTGKALTSYGQQMGSQEYQNAYNRYQTNRSNQLAPLFTLTGSGQASAAGQAAAAGNYATGAANNLTSAGAARAAGDVGSANALTSSLGSYLNYSGQQDLLAAYNERTRQSAYRS